MSSINEHYAADICGETAADIRTFTDCPEQAQPSEGTTGKRIFVLEAKLGPNKWQTVADVYPQAQLRSFFTDHDDARQAKSNLKSMLLGPWRTRFSKMPIRIRELDQAGD